MNILNLSTCILNVNTDILCERKQTIPVYLPHWAGWVPFSPSRREEKKSKMELYRARSDASPSKICRYLSMSAWWFSSISIWTFKRHCSAESPHNSFWLILSFRTYFSRVSHLDDSNISALLQQCCVHVFQVPRVHGKRLLRSYYAWRRK